MYAQVDMEIPMGSRVVVPKSAVLRTGEQDIVFVDQSQGRMEVRGVRLGVDVDGAYEVLSGLRRGERVVTAANFLIDAESQVQGAVRTWEQPQGGGPQALSPAPVGETQRGLTVEILEPQQATVGRNTIRLAAKDASGRLVENADVDVSLFMPQMGTMAPMTAAARLQPLGQGVYAGTVEIPMAYSWQTTVTVRREGRVIGSVRTTIRAQ
jgi:hypothetical protein